jgi:hypothetical protein
MRAISVLRRLIEGAVRELDALEGLPISQKAQYIVRAAIAKAFDAGIKHGQGRDTDPPSKEEPEPPP